MEVAGFLFTCSTRMVPMIQNTHYISLEIYFQWEFSAIEIVEIGSVVMEKTATQITSYADEFPPRTLAITGTAPFGLSPGHCYLPNWVPFLLAIAPHSTNVLLRFYDDLDGLGYVFGVEKQDELLSDGR